MKKRFRTVMIGDVMVDVTVRERVCVLRIAPPPGQPRGWFETWHFLRAKPGQPLKVPNKRELREIVKKTQSTARGPGTFRRAEP